MYENDHEMSDVTPCGAKANITLMAHVHILHLLPVQVVKQPDQKHIVYFDSDYWGNSDSVDQPFKSECQLYTVTLTCF